MTKKAGVVWMVEMEIGFTALKRQWFKSNGGLVIATKGVAPMTAVDKWCQCTSLQRDGGGLEVFVNDVW